MAGFAFPDFALDPGVANFHSMEGSSAPSSGKRSSQFSRDNPSSASSQDSQRPVLEIPASDSIGDLMGGMQLHPSETKDTLMVDEAPMFDFDPGFAFDATGNLVTDDVPAKVYKLYHILALTEAHANG